MQSAVRRALEAPFKKVVVEAAVLWALGDPWKIIRVYGIYIYMNICIYICIGIGIKAYTYKCIYIYRYIGLYLYVYV